MDKYDNTDNHQLISTSPNFRTDLAKKLEELVPEAIADGKVDVVKLKELLAEDAGEPNERFGLFWPGKKQGTSGGTRADDCNAPTRQGREQRLGHDQQYFHRGR